MPAFDRYPVRVYGGPNGLQGLRAATYLSEGPDGRAWIYFHKAGDPVPADLETPTGFIVMHLPEERFDAVVDLLRNEEPLFVSLTSGVARLSSGGGAGRRGRRLSKA
jgi:hypothetical protein